MKQRATTMGFLAAAVSALALACPDRDLGSVGQPDAGGSGDTNPGSGTNGGGGGAGVLPPDNGQCTSIARPSTAQLPHVNASGAQATAVVQALAAIYAAQTPPIAQPASYVIPSLSCSKSSCTFTVKAGTSQTEIQADDPALAKDLFDALKAAGVVPCDTNDPKIGGPSIKAADMNVSANQVQFDDVSTYSHGWVPNVVASGAAGQGLLSAFASAAINDCDPSSSVFMICNNFAGIPQCGYQRRPYQKVGSSWFLNGCLGSGAIAGGALSNDQSLTMWQAILVAAQASGFKPTDGPIEATTVINAHFFTWDGSSARFFLLTGTATPPMPARP